MRGWDATATTHPTSLTCPLDDSVFRDLFFDLQQQRQPQQQQLGEAGLFVLSMPPYVMQPAASTLSPPQSAGARTSLDPHNLQPQQQQQQQQVRDGASNAEEERGVQGGCGELLTQCQPGTSSLSDAIPLFFGSPNLEPPTP